MQRTIFNHVRPDCNATQWARIMKLKTSHLSPQTFLVMLLLATCFAVDLVVGAMAEDHRWPDAAGVTGIGLAIGQTSMLAVWLVWGSWNIAWRAVVVTMGTFCLSWLVEVSAGDPNPSGWFSIMLAFVAIVTTTLFVSRLLGYRINLDAEKQPSTDASQQPRQFSIWSLLSAMTAAGILLAFFRVLDFPASKFVVAILFFLILTVTTCVILFTAFLSHWGVAVGVIVVACPLAGALLCVTGFPPKDDWVPLMALSIIHGVSVFAIASVLKIAGLRLNRA